MLCPPRPALSRNVETELRCVVTYMTPCKFVTRNTQQTLWLSSGVYHEAYSFRWVPTFNSDRVPWPWAKFRYFGCSLSEESFQITLYLPQWQNIINSDNFSEVNTEYGEVRFPVQILCFMMMLNIIKIWKRWKILRFYEFTRAEGYLGSSNSNFIVIVIASSVWILVQW